MPLTVCIILACDYPGCTRKPHAVHRPMAHWYTEIGKLARPDVKGWDRREVYGKNARQVCYCPDHAPEVARIDKRVSSWGDRYRKHADDHGKLSANAWASRYPPPEVPPYLADVVGTWLTRIEPPTPKALAAIDAQGVASAPEIVAGEGAPT